MTHVRARGLLVIACIAGSSILCMTRCGASDPSTATDAGPDTAVADTSIVEPGGDATPEVATDTATDTVAPLFANPRDGNLYAAAGFAVITPTPENHPCLQLLGGTSSNRLATGVHDELEARALLLAEDDVSVVLVSVDLVGWLGSDIQPIRDALAARGVDPLHVIIASTHTHSAPDTMGIWGPQVGVSGRCPEYVAFLAETIVALVERLAPELVPVTAAVAETAIDLPELATPSLITDFRIPRTVNNRLIALRLDDLAGGTVATLVNWNVHPEAMIGSSEYSADMPRWTRLRLEKELGGTAVYLSGTVGGLQTILDEPFPARTEAGLPVLENGQPKLVSDNNEEKAWSAGHVIAELAVAALANAITLAGPLTVDAERAMLPFENPMMILAMAGDMIPEQPLDDSNKETCGPYGCMPYDVTRVRFGALELVTLPGELFPETAVGREASTHDWGTDQNGTWGVKEYPAMQGYRAALAEGHILMEAGLANTEVGYLVPASDYVASNHPGYYEEYFCISPKAEGIVREAVTTLLARP